MGHLLHLGIKKHHIRLKLTQQIPQGTEEKKIKKTSIYYAFNYIKANSKKMVAVSKSMYNIIETF